MIDRAKLSDIIEYDGGTASAEWTRLAQFAAYHRGNFRRPYEPKTATAEFRSLVNKSRTNVVRLVVSTLTQRLIVDGYKASSTAIDNAKPWEWWQANGLDSRQKALYDQVAVHGYGYNLVLPGDQGPVIRPQSPRTWWAKFDDHDDNWPTLGLRCDNDSEDGAVWRLLDEDEYLIVKRQKGGSGFEVIEERVHGLGVCPLIIFRNEHCLDDWPVGEVQPVMDVQDRLNQTVFDLLVAQTYSAAPQKYIAGLSAPVDSDGNPILDFRAFAKSVWVDPDPNTKFGSLPEANLANLVTAIESTLRVYGLMSQTPPHYLLGDLVNLSAEALLAADTTLAKKCQDRQALHGESWEQTLRLAARADGDSAAEDDQESQVIWRDTEPRSIAQMVDALGKLATMLAVPPEALWEKVPGVTRTDLELWRSEAKRKKLADAVAQAQAAQQQAALPAPAPRPNPAGGVPGAQPTAA